MKSLIEIGVVALVVGGISAAGSFYWQQRPLKTAAAQEVAAVDSQADAKPADLKAENSDLFDGHSSAGLGDKVTSVVAQKPATGELSSEFGPPVAVRPPFNPSGDEAGELINKLRVRATTASRHERKVAEREDLMKLIVDDLRTEQTNATKVRQRIIDETSQSLLAVDEARRDTESERAALQDEQIETRRNSDEQIKEIRREKDDAARAAEEALRAVREEQEEMKKQLDDLRKGGGRDRSGSAEETVNLKKTVGVVDSMPAGDTAKILQELVQDGKTDAVVAVLDAMKPRQSAKVLSAITEEDPVLAADLVDRLKKLKKAGVPSTQVGK